MINLFFFFNKVAAARGSADLTAFCGLASRYLECFKTYTRGCVGYFVKYLTIFLLILKYIN